MSRASWEKVVPRCACGAAIGWTRLIRRLPCQVCAIRQALARRRREGA